MTVRKKTVVIFVKNCLLSELASTNAISAELGRANINSSLTCPFTVDLNSICGSTYTGSFTGKCGLALEEIDSSWQCRIRDIEVCDGFSNCLTDECDCGDDVFKCADGVGCITRKNLCNGFKDCGDGSDECMCEGVVTCYVEELKYCVPKDMYCQGKLLQYRECKACPKVDCAGIVPDQFFFGENNLNPYVLCLREYNLAMRGLNRTEGMIYNNQQFLTWCSKNCGGYIHFCGSIEMEFSGPTFFLCNLTLRGR